MGSPSARPEGRIPPRWRDYFRLHRVQSPVRGHVRHLRPQGRTGCEGWGVASRLPRHGICPRRHGPHGPRNPGSPCTKPHLPGPAELPSSSKLLHPPMDGNGRIKPPAGSTPLPSTPLPSSRSSVANLCKETEKFIVSFFSSIKNFEHGGNTFFDIIDIRGIFIVVIRSLYAIIRSNVRDAESLRKVFFFFHHR